MRQSIPFCPKRLERLNAVKQAESEGVVVDSMDVRAELIRQLKAGEKTLEQIQAELATIKRNAKRSGKITRSQAFSRG